MKRVMMFAMTMLLVMPLTVFGEEDAERRAEELDDMADRLREVHKDFAQRLEDAKVEMNEKLASAADRLADRAAEVADALREGTLDLHEAKVWRVTEAAETAVEFIYKDLRGITRFVIEETEDAELPERLLKDVRGQLNELQGMAAALIDARAVGAREVARNTEARLRMSMERLEFHVTSVELEREFHQIMKDLGGREELARDMREGFERIQKLRRERLETIMHTIELHLHLDALHDKIERNEDKMHELGEQIRDTNRELGRRLGWDEDDEGEFDEGEDRDEDELDDDDEEREDEEMHEDDEDEDEDEEE